MSATGREDAATFSPEHPHEPEIPPAYDDEGRCLICGLRVERDRLAAALEASERVRAAAESVAQTHHGPWRTRFTSNGHEHVPKEKLERLREALASQEPSG